jgi:hypothetical protein
MWSHIRDRDLIHGTWPLSVACEGCPAVASRRAVSAVRQTIRDDLSLGRTVRLTQGHERRGFSRVDAERAPPAHGLPLGRVGSVRLISREGRPRARGCMRPGRASLVISSLIRLTLSVRLSVQTSLATLPEPHGKSNPDQLSRQGKSNIAPLLSQKGVWPNSGGHHAPMLCSEMHSDYQAVSRNVKLCLSRSVGI